MTKQNILAILKTQLGKLSPSAAESTRLEQEMNAAIAFLETKGIVFDTSITAGLQVFDASVEQVQFILEYATYLDRKRFNPNEPLPRNLVFTTNSYIFKRKAAAADDT